MSSLGEIVVMKSNSSQQKVLASRVKHALVVAAGLHLGLCLLAFCSNLAPSQLQRDLMSTASFYLRPLNLELGLVPLELTHNYQQIEGPFRLRCQFAGGATDQWTDLGKYFSGRREQLRLQRYFRELNALLLEERSDTASRLLVRFLAVIGRSTSRPIVRVRFERELRFGRSEFNSPEFLMASENEKLVVLFEANVVDFEGEVSLVSVTEDPRTSKSNAK